MRIKNKTLDFLKRTYVMGVLNVTPDSFSDGGEYDSLSRALAHATHMVAQGADIIDVGGESTRTKFIYGEGVKSVDEQEELNRVIPVIKALNAALEVPISIDTYKANVAFKAVQAGASMVNDVWGLQRDPAMADVVARLGVPVVIMHNQAEPLYEGDLLESIFKFLDKSLELAFRAGIAKENIILDPGVCFGKNFQDSVLLMNRLGEFKAYYQDYPVLLGTSRKSMIGRLLDLPPKERTIGTAATSVYGVTQGVNMVRVHDVDANVQALKVADSIVRGLHSWIN